MVSRKPHAPNPPRRRPPVDPADNAPGASSGGVKAGDVPTDPPGDDVAPGSTPAQSDVPTANLPGDPRRANKRPDTRDPDPGR